jgi:uracil-DNA glycosylase
VFVLGAYPSGLHVMWQPPASLGLARSQVKALIVDNEPEVFWGGGGAEDIFKHWRAAVGFDGAWGGVQLASNGNNGPSGAWLTKHILRPLGVSREDCWITDCLDTARRSEGQTARLADMYAPAALALGLPEAVMEPAPKDAGIVREARAKHLDRLRTELDTCQPEIIVSLGNAALRVLRLVVQVEENDPGTALRADSYGRSVRVRVGARPATWLPLVHPRSGERTPPWPATHSRWKAAVTRT